MTGLEALHSVRFVAVEGKRLPICRQPAGIVSRPGGASGQTRRRN